MEKFTDQDRSTQIVQGLLFKPSGGKPDFKSVHSIINNNALAQA